MSGITPIKQLLEKLEPTITWLLEVKQYLKQVDSLQSQLTRVLIDLVKLEDPRVDQILAGHGIVVSENGTQLFPRPKPYPQAIEIKTPFGGNGSN